MVNLCKYDSFGKNSRVHEFSCKLDLPRSQSRARASSSRSHKVRSLLSTNSSLIFGSNNFLSLSILFSGFNSIAVQTFFIWLFPQTIFRDKCQVSPYNHLNYLHDDNNRLHVEESQSGAHPGLLRPLQLGGGVRIIVIITTNIRGALLYMGGGVGNSISTLSNSISFALMISKQFLFLL